MTRDHKGHFAKKHPSDRGVDQKIIEAVKESALEGTLSCTSAFNIVDEMNTTPEEVGFTLDFLEIRIEKCQLGLYGYSAKKKIVKQVESISPALEGAIREALVNERLPCASAWEIAEKLGLNKMEVSSACETLKLKISSCQLGAF